jgi:mRNA interferase RelE/StbE
MTFRIVIAPEAVAALRAIRVYDRARILEAIERHLRHEPMRTSRSRIKALRDLRHPQYRLRIDEHRVFYDLDEDCVEIVAVVSKQEAADWLERWGIGVEQEGPEDEDGAPIGS